MELRSRFDAGFTLAEMLTVIIIITLLAGLLITALPRIEEMARTSACASNLRQISQGLKTYSVDWGGFYPPLIQPKTVSMEITEETKTQSPWYEVLIAKYGFDPRIFHCPADKNYDPERVEKLEPGRPRLAYMSDNISYGLNYDVKYDPRDLTLGGIPYKVTPDGSRFVGPSGQPIRTPAGNDRYPDFYRSSDVADPRTFILGADSNSEYASVENFGISIPMGDEKTHKIGARHKAVDRPGANVLFADDHVELWASRTPDNPTDKDIAKDINDVSNRRYWTLPND